MQGIEYIVMYLGPTLKEFIDNWER
jgi:hypothetical protein